MLRLVFLVVPLRLPLNLTSRVHPESFKPFELNLVREKAIASK